MAPAPLCGDPRSDGEATWGGFASRLQALDTFSSPLAHSGRQAELPDQPGPVPGVFEGAHPDPGSPCAGPGLQPGLRAARGLPELLPRLQAGALTPQTWPQWESALLGGELFLWITISSGPVSFPTQVKCFQKHVYSTINSNHVYNRYLLNVHGLHWHFLKVFLK